MKKLFESRTVTIAADAALIGGAALLVNRQLPYLPGNIHLGPFWLILIGAGLAFIIKRLWGLAVAGGIVYLCMFLFGHYVAPYVPEPKPISPAPRAEKRAKRSPIRASKVEERETAESPR